MFLKGLVKNTYIKTVSSPLKSSQTAYSDDALIPNITAKSIGLNVRSIIKTLLPNNNNNNSKYYQTTNSSEEVKITSNYSDNVLIPNITANFLGVGVEYNAPNILSNNGKSNSNYVQTPIKECPPFKYFIKKIELANLEYFEAVFADCALIPNSTANLLGIGNINYIPITIKPSVGPLPPPPPPLTRETWYSFTDPQWDYFTDVEWFNFFDI